MRPRAAGESETATASRSKRRRRARSTDASGQSCSSCGGGELEDLVAVLLELDRTHAANRRRARTAPQATPWRSLRASCRRRPCRPAGRRGLGHGTIATGRTAERLPRRRRLIADAARRVGDRPLDLLAEREATGRAIASGDGGRRLELGDRPFLTLVDEHQPGDRHHPGAIEQRMVDGGSPLVHRARASRPAAT